MKKVFLGIAALSLLTFASCSDDDNNETPWSNNLKGSAWEYVGYVTQNGDSIEAREGSFPNEEFNTLEFINDTLLQTGLRYKTHELKYNSKYQFKLADIATEPTMDIFYPDFYFCTKDGFTNYKRTESYLNLYVNKEITGENDGDIQYLIYQNKAEHLK